MKANTFKIIYKSITCDLCSVNVQVAYFRFFDIPKKRLSTFRNSECLVVSIQDTTERIQIVSTFDIVGSILCDTDRFPS